MAETFLLYNRITQWRSRGCIKLLSDKKISKFWTGAIIWHGRQHELLKHTLLIQKLILRFSTSTGIPVAVARFLEVQLKVDNKYTLIISTIRYKVFNQLLKLPHLVLKLHYYCCMYRSYCKLHCLILKLQLQLEQFPWLKA